MPVQWPIYMYCHSMWVKGAGWVVSPGFAAKSKIYRAFRRAIENSYMR